MDSKREWRTYSAFVKMVTPVFTKWILTILYLSCVKSNTIKFEDSAAHIKLNSEKWGAESVRNNEWNSNARREAKIGVANDTFERFEHRFESAE